ncbi:MAG TPA: maleylpyruvate isomerase family mycothiol-dependent enzyme [Actinomycetota bacterium]|nr:maleylpyruvate isomerase family mycothiol-dependent enzyme [Actinomycetota bacterium]
MTTKRSSRPSPQATGAISLDGDRALARGDAVLPRLTGLLRGTPDRTRTAIGSWSVADVAAHLALLFELYPAIVRGQPSPVTDLDDLPALSASFLEAYPERDVDVLADKVESAWRGYATAVREVGSEQMMTWHGGIQMRVATLTGILLGEMLVHGYDVARAIGRPWEIQRQDAVLTLKAIAELLPHYLTEEGRRARASFRLVVRGGDPLTMRFHSGTLEVDEHDEDPVDCKMSIDPVAFLLVGYGRTGLWRAVLKGQMFAYGRKPWLSLRFQRYLRNP